MATRMSTPCPRSRYLADHLGTQFENSADIGVFAKLTNAYVVI